MSSFGSLFENARAFYEARHEPENMRPLTEWYWRTLLMCALIAIVGIVMYGTGEFFGVLSNLNSAGGASRSTPPNILNRKQLTDTLAAHEARLNAFVEAKNNRQVYTDPSR